MMPPSEQQARSCQSSSHHQILPHSGLAPIVGPLSLLMRPTIWSILTLRLGWPAASTSQCHHRRCRGFFARKIRQAEVGAARNMIERVMDRFGLYPEHLAGDSAYGAAEMVGWLVEERGIEPHVAVIDKSERKDGAFSRSDFFYDQEDDIYICPDNKVLTTTGTAVSGDLYNDRASTDDCRTCPLKRQCCPKEKQRKITRSIHERAKDMARAIAKTDAGEASRRDRKKVEMLFAHLKRILQLGRLLLRGPCGASDEFLLAATAQNLQKLAKLRPKPEPAAALA